MQSTVTVKPWQREYFSPSYKIAFLKAMSLRIQGGASIGRALNAVIRSEKNPNKLRDMSPALVAMEQGESVATAMGQLGFFNSTVLAILQAGERTGMNDAINFAVAHLTIKQRWFREHAVVIFILGNEIFSTIFTPILLHTEILPWIRANITLPPASEALIKYQADMDMAEKLTVVLMSLTAWLIIIGCISIYRIIYLQASTKVLSFFHDSAMAVGFRLAAAMLKAGITIETIAQDLTRQAPGWSRLFWVSVYQQLQLAIEPAQALIQRGLYSEECSLLANHTNAKQLAETFLVLADDREHHAKRGRDLLIVGGAIVTVVYILLCLSIGMWIYITYDTALSAGLEALGSGF